MAVCEWCNLRTRVSKKTGLCRPCVREMQRVTEKYLDGDIFAPLRVTESMVLKRKLRRTGESGK